MGKLTPDVNCLAFATASAINILYLSGMSFPVFSARFAPISFSTVALLDGSIMIFHAM
jgi:hypothetical protein